MKVLYRVKLFILLMNIPIILSTDFCGLKRNHY
nr:MAG TPA: hypothetical protein [Caudoviricetes sp.]